MILPKRDVPSVLEVHVEPSRRRIPNRSIDRENGSDRVDIRQRPLDREESRCPAT